MVVRLDPTESISFGGLDIAYTRDVLEPRPWTELQSHWAVEVADVVPSGPILEVCCGAGHIGLAAAVASGRPLVQVDANDIACELAVRNARAAGIADRVSVVCSTIESFSKSAATYPLIIADPPYIPTAEVQRFPSDPVLAIDGGEDGLALVEHCLDLFARHLEPNGRGLLQLGPLDHARPMFGRFRDVVRAVEVRSAAPDRNVVLFERNLHPRAIPSAAPDPGPAALVNARTQHRVDECR